MIRFTAAAVAEADQAISVLTCAVLQRSRWLKAMTLGVEGDDSSGFIQR